MIFDRADGAPVGTEKSSLLDVVQQVFGLLATSLQPDRSPFEDSRNGVTTMPFHRAE